MTTIVVAQRPSGFGKQKSPGITGKITGTLIDTLSKEPIEFASIALYQKGNEKIINGTISDERGHFKISDVENGQYELQINFLGYTPKRIRGITLTKKKPDYLAHKILLSQDGIVLNEVEVVGQAAVIESKVDRIVYNAEKDVTSLGGDASDVLAKVPMLAVDLDGNVTMRGSSNIQILINGRPSGMFSDNVADALKMMPAEQIKSVEVITSPSAKYDAEGTAGIINIVTRKKSVEGVSGSVNLTTGTRHNRGTGNLSIGKNRFGVNLGGSATYSWPNEGQNSFYREDYLDGQVRTLDQNGVTTSSRLGFSGQGSLFYDINAYNSINSSFQLRGFTFDNQGDVHSLYMDPSQSLVEEYQRLTDTDRGRNGFEWTTDYLRKFDRKDQELSFAFQLNGNNSDMDQLYEQQSEDPALRLTETSFNKGRNSEMTFQGDYTHPFSDRLKLELGSKAVLREINSDYIYNVYEFDQGRFNEDPSRTNLFDYNQDVYAGYASLNVELPQDISMIAGMRYEKTEIQGDYRTDAEGFENGYSNFIPSIILSKKIKQYNTLKLSYNQRIQRPSLRYINPFRATQDSRIISEGNPDLAPELSHQVETGYTTIAGRTVVTTSVYYRRTTDVIQSFLEVNENGISRTTFQNIGKSDAFGVNIYGSVTLAKKLTLRGSIDSYYVDIKAQDGSLENSDFMYRARLNGALKLKNDWAVEAFGMFNSSRTTVQGNNPSFSIFYMGVKKDIMQKKGSIGINIVEPFSQYKPFRSNLQGENFYQESEYLRPFRSFGINFRYRFGKLNFGDRRSKIRNDDLKRDGDSQNMD